MKDTLRVLLWIMMACFWSCSSGDEEISEPTPKPESNKVEISASVPVVEQKGSTATVTFTTNAAWTASVSSSTSWVTVSPTSGNAGTHTLTITTTENDTYDERNATVTIKAGNASKNITVTQKQKDALIVTSNKVEMGAEGGNFTIEAKANVSLSYEIEESAKEWIVAGESRALTTNTLKFNAKANNKIERRQGNIILKGGDGLTETVTVYQEGEEVSLVLTTEKDMTIGSEGGTLKIELESNTEIKMEELEADWLRQTSSRSMSAYTYYIEVDANETYDERNAAITFTSGDKQQIVTVTQKQKDALIVTSNKVEMGAEGGNFTIEAKANVSLSYEIEESAKEWIVAGESRALTTNALKFNAKANEQKEGRQGTITLKGGDGLTETVTVYQEGEKPTLVITSNDVIVGSDGETIKIELKSNVDYTMVLPNVDWITKEESRAISAYTHYLTIAPNESYDQRSAMVYVQNEAEGLKDSISITQLQLDAIIVAKNEYEVAPEGTQLEFKVSSNVDFEVSVSVDWIKQNTGSRGLVEKALSFTIEENEAKESRSGEIIVTYGELKQTIKVNQQGAPDYEAIERAALIDLYQATGGDNWTRKDNWCSDKPIGEWYGITTYERGLVFDINLPNNNLTGSIPESIGNLRQLRIVNLDTNQLSGELPESIGNLTELTSLGVGNNRLTGNIPESIGNLVNLVCLYLYSNQLSGELPKSIGNWKQLEYLNLDMNKLSGELPEIIGDLTELRSFCAVNNSFTGNIPESIGNMVNLESLYLDSNQLSGELPESIGNLTKLTHFMVGHNNLSGTIPESINKMTSLTNFYIRGNYFTGMVPNCLMEMDTWATGWHEILDQRGEGFSKDGYIIQAPKFSENTIDGKVLDYSVYSENEYTILYHYFDWCGYKYDFTPMLVDLYDGYKNKGLEVITFSVDGTVESYREFAETFKTKWPYITLINNKEMFNAHTWISPGVCVVDKDGYIIFNSLTEDWRDLGAFLYEKLGEPESSGSSEKPQLYESTDYSKDGEVKQLQKATKGKGIDIVLMGDAYTDRLIADGTYDNTMQTAMELFFTEEPYKSFRDHFNVYSVTAVSKNEIYSQNSETVFKGYFGGGTYVGGDDSTAFAYALKAIGEERMDMDQASIIVIMNYEVYAGTCYMYYPTVGGDWSNGVSVSYFPIGNNGTETLEGLIHHEACGHGFAKFADEYTNSIDAIPEEEVGMIRSDQKNMGWWKNVDFTNDLSQIRWNYFISDTRYANEELGAYEGGLTYLTGVWRPTAESIMRYNWGGFNAPSREAIYYRIHKLAYGADWKYDYEEFVKYDEINRNSASRSAIQPLTEAERREYIKNHRPPTIIKGTWRDAMKKGKKDIVVPLR